MRMHTGKKRKIKERRKNQQCWGGKKKRESKKIEVLWREKGA